MRNVTRFLLVATVAGLGLSGLACGDDVTIVEPPPQPPPVPPPGPQVQPSIQIAQITNVAGDVINPAAVAGQINVVLNVEPGTGNTLQSVAILIDGVQVASQTFSSASIGSRSQGEVKASASESASSDPTQITLPFDTREENANGDRYANGSHNITASMTHSGGTASAAQQTLTFTNPNEILDIDFSGNSAKDAAGDTWFGNGDIVATCSVRYFDSPPDELELEIAGGGAVWSSSAGTDIDAPASQAGDLTVTAPATIVEGDNDTVEFDDVTVTCNLPASSNGYDANGDGDTDDAGEFDPGVAGSFDEDFRLDNVGPDTPTAADFCFEDDRFDDPRCPDPPNSWTNPTTVFSLASAALDGGVGINPADIMFFEALFDDFTGDFEPGADRVATGDDLSETNGGGDIKLLVTEAPDRLGNPADIGAADIDACTPCSNAFDNDKTAIEVSRFGPPGPIYNPDGSEFAYVFRADDDESGTDWDNVDSTTGDPYDNDQTFIDVSFEAADATVPPDDPPCSIAGEADGSTSTQDIEVSCTGLDLAVNDNGLVASGQVADESGIVTLLEDVDVEVDNTAPDISMTQIPAENINAGGVSNLTINFAGTIADANPLGDAEITGSVDGTDGTDGDGTCGTGTDTEFTSAFADKRSVDLDESFTASFTLKSQGSGTVKYCFAIDAEDSATDIDGDADPNVSVTVDIEVNVDWGS